MSTNGEDATERILSEWSGLWVGDTSNKDHLTPMCPHVRPGYERKSPEQKPAAHVDLCSWCVEHYTNWRNGVDATVDCERCGGETDVPARNYKGSRLCHGCYQQVRLGR